MREARHARSADGAYQPDLPEQSLQNERSLLVKRTSRGSIVILAAVAVAVAVFAIVTVPPPPQALADYTIDWKKVLPAKALDLLVQDSSKMLASATRSASNFKLKSKSVQNEAYVLAIYAAGGMSQGDDELAQRCAGLWQAAVALADAAKKKDLDEAQRLVKLIQDFQHMEADGDTTGDANLRDTIPIDNLMEIVQSLYVRFDSPKRGAYKRLTPREWRQRRKLLEILLASHKMAALTAAIAAHAPDKDPDPEKGQTKKAWLDSTEAVLEASMEMAKAVRSRKQSDFRKAVVRLDSACTKCHEVYRVELD